MSGASSPTGREAGPAAELAVALDGPVRVLFERIVSATAAGTPDLTTIGEALAELAADRDYILRWVARIGGTGGSLAIHAPATGPRLMIAHRPEGGLSAVHDHGTWVAISPIAGLEAHRRYRVSGEGAGARLEVFETLSLVPTEAVTLLPPDDLHDHGHLVGRGLPAHILIVTGDNQRRYTRNEWDLATGRHRVLAPGDAGRWLATDPWPGP